MARALGDPQLASRLGEVMRGDVLFDAFTRGRYSTDASIYQIEPIGVALPQDADDIVAAIAWRARTAFRSSRAAAAARRTASRSAVRW